MQATRMHKTSRGIEEGGVSQALRRRGGKGGGWKGREGKQEDQPDSTPRYICCLTRAQANKSGARGFKQGNGWTKQRVVVLPSLPPSLPCSRSITQHHFPSLPHGSSLGPYLTCLIVWAWLVIWRCLSLLALLLAPALGGGRDEMREGGRVGRRDG